MSVLVVYYSRTGITRAVAKSLAAEVGADLDEVVDIKDRSGVLGYLGGGKDATLRKLTEIKPPQKDPAGYDLVIIGTPVWAFTMAPAIRTYMTQRRGSFKKLAFFCTLGGAGDERTFRDMSELAGATPVSTMSVTEKEVKADKHTNRVKDFAAVLRNT
jgi:flavodoxin